MSTATTLAAYGAALVVVFGAAAGVGNAVGPIGATAEQGHSTTGTSDDAAHDDGGHGDQ